MRVMVVWCPDWSVVAALEEAEAMLAWVPYTQLANLTGRPAMSVPLHRTAAGLPLGVQFVAPLQGEATLIRLAAQLEAAQA